MLTYFCILTVIGTRSEHSHGCRLTEKCLKNEQNAGWVSSKLQLFAVLFSTKQVTVRMFVGGNNPPIGMICGVFFLNVDKDQFIHSIFCISCRYRMSMGRYARELLLTVLVGLDQ